MAENMNPVASGNDRCFYMTDGKGSGKFVWIGGEQSNNISRSADTIEVAHKKTQWREFLAGKKSATASVSCNLDDTATSAQRKMLSAFNKGQKVFCFSGIVEGAEGSETPVKGTAFEALITSCNDDNPQDNISSRSFDLQVSGEPIEYPVEA